MLTWGNHVFVAGNLTKDPGLKKTPGGRAVCTFSIAVNRDYQAGEEEKKDVSFFTIETWATLAENCATYLEKGREVHVIGRLQQDRWTDAEGGRHERVKIVANRVEFGRRPKEKHEGGGKGDDAPKPEIISIEEDELLKAV
ncbi:MULTISPECIES: single-stranded DNA-binding protein [Sediminispirochaeta]|uniref:Single-stranded DNA-binding protein n=1 Tax=Sediminispirochaeta smaragdinae (strain DSM 11293 / JCM 15392 / SEBR 4228) TaxID=573413 RepID=E1R7U9_SEDSS|nr:MULTISPECIES: single-stranded DNA-binding protein [Sediminispirochaeta]ADK82804.1 single-strand binding protein [Sediminispirochaeta smaragdinae DSM 11293]